MRWEKEPLEIITGKNHDDPENLRSSRTQLTDQALNACNDFTDTSAIFFKKSAILVLIKLIALNTDFYHNKRLESPQLL